MKEIKVKAPAKVNLTLEVLNKRADGFHNIKSIMHSIDLYDYVTLNYEEADDFSIDLSGNSSDIPYDSSNLAYKAAVKYFEKIGKKSGHLKIYIEKNIPVAAGLAGGSADAAAVFYALNSIFDSFLDEQGIDELCAELGSDLNFCYYGGCSLCTSRGEIREKLPAASLDISLVKPKLFGISAKEAYTKFSSLKNRSLSESTEKMKSLMLLGQFDSDLISNSLEDAVINDYNELLEIKSKLPNAIMSGSGPTFFVLDSKIIPEFDEDKFIKIEGLKTIATGISVCS